ncbi:MAG TPA: hypothetical protein V6D22_21210 [Candidatus Obscuribacterales bacterium]
MLSKNGLFLAAVVAAMVISLMPASQPASAQVMFIQSRPTVIIRQAPYAVLEQTPVLSAPLGQTVIQKSITQSVLVPTTTGPMSNFLHRLDMIRDQISLGLQKGMLSADAAASLSDRTTNLTALADGMLAKGMITDSANDTLEAQINLLNQDVAGAMMQ